MHKSKHRHRLGRMVALLVVLSSIPAKAEVIFEQPPPPSPIGEQRRSAWCSDSNVLDANERTYDNFAVPVEAVINEVTWYGGYLTLTPLGNAKSETTSWDVSFYADQNGRPGRLIEQFPVALDNVNSTYYGPWFDSRFPTPVEFFEFNTTFPAFTASPGTTYWFSVQSHSPANTQNVCLAWLSKVGENGQAWQDGTQRADRAFTLFGDFGKFTGIPMQAGETYQQDFDAALGTDGAVTGQALPTGWYTSFNGSAFPTEITRRFPIATSLGNGAPLLNAGAENDPDRALATAATEIFSQPSLQFVAEISGTDASGLQLGFDVEAWDASTRQATASIGEAAFDVLVDIDRGSGFELLLDLGTTTTGRILEKPTGDRLDGNAAPNRVSYDSGPVNADIPTGSVLRVRWTASESVTENWVFGLDNVSLSLFSGGLNTVGDFNGDGLLSIDDLNMLSSVIQANNLDTQYDLDGSGVVDLADRQYWVTDVKQTWLGDTNLDNVFDSGDMIAVFLAGEYEDALDGNSTWATGDWNGDGDFNSGDMISAFLDGGYEAGPRAAVSAVPEPSAILLTAIALLGLVRLRAR